MTLIDASALGAPAVDYPVCVRVVVHNEPIEDVLDRIQQMMGQGEPCISSRTFPIIYRKNQHVYIRSVSVPEENKVVAMVLLKNTDKVFMLKFLGETKMIRDHNRGCL